MRIKVNTMGLRSLMLALTLAISGLAAVSTPAQAQVQSVSSTDFANAKERQAAGPQFGSKDCIFEEATPDHIRACLLSGRQARVEAKNKRDGILYRHDLMTNTLSVYEYLRVHGHGENFWTRSIYCTDPEARVIPGNTCAAMHMQTSRVLSGATTFGRAMSAGMGAMLPAVAAPIASNLTACREGCITNQVITNTASAAQSLSQNRTDMVTAVDINGLAGCATGTCKKQ